MNVVIKCQVHHLSTEKEWKNLQTVPTCTPIDTNQDYSIIKVQDLKGFQNIFADFFSCSQSASTQYG